MRSKADETLVIVETLICPLQISQCQISSTHNACSAKLVLQGRISFTVPKVLNQFYMQCLQCQISCTVPAVPTLLNQFGVQ